MCFEYALWDLQSFSGANVDEIMLVARANRNNNLLLRNTSINNLCTNNEITLSITCLHKGEPYSSATVAGFAPQ